MNDNKQAFVSEKLIAVAQLTRVVVGAIQKFVVRYLFRLGNVSLRRRRKTIKKLILSIVNFTITGKIF